MLYLYSCGMDKTITKCEIFSNRYGVSIDDPPFAECYVLIFAHFTPPYVSLMIIKA